MKVLVCGSRGLRPKDYREVLERLIQLSPETQVIHGNERHVDQFAAACARAFNMPEPQAFPADWERYGKRAGFIRNRQMLDAKPDLVIACWDGVSPGTKDTIDEAERRGIPVELVP